MSNLYIYEQGSNLSFRENRLIVRVGKEREDKDILSSMPIENIDNIVLFGGVQVSTACIQELLSRGVPLTYKDLGFDAYIVADRVRNTISPRGDENYLIGIAVVGNFAC